MKKKIFGLKLLGVLFVFAMMVASISSVTVSAADFSGYDKATYESPISPTKKGMQHIGKTWFYEYSIGYENEFFPMESTKKGDMLYCDTALQSDGNPTGEKANVCNPWGETLFLLPGNREAQISVNAVQTFEVPNDGHVVVSPSTVVRHYGYEDIDRSPNQDIEVAVYVNEKQVWPQGDKWESVNNTLKVPNQLSVPELDLGKLKKGDRVRFVIGCGNMQFFQWEDHSTWEVVMNVYTPAAATTTSTSATTTDVQSDATTTAGNNDTTTTDGQSNTTTTVADDVDVDAPKSDDPIWPWIVGGVAIVAVAAVVVIIVVLKSKKAQE